MSENKVVALNDWKCKQSKTCGLRYEPTTEPEYSDSEQRIFMKTHNGIALPMCVKANTAPYKTIIHKGPSVRQCHVNLIKDSITDETRTILEIGINVYTKPLLSTTRVILEQKHDDCVYLGIDVRNKSSIDDTDKNVNTMAIDSKMRHTIREKMLELGMSTIDLLMIDGDHSINMTINDWCFSEFLSSFGIVIIHDTNVHIGPRALFDAIDELSFEKRLVSGDMVKGMFPDYGIGIARRLF
jgi:hypothetical protein